MGRDNEALSDYALCKQHEPKHAFCASNIAHALAALGNVVQAMDEIKAALKLNR